MTKKSTKITISVVSAVLVVCIIALCLFFLLPRQFVNVAKTGQLDNVQSITYKTSPCCGYMEGAELERTITDADIVEQLVARFNAAKMKWKMPQMLVGGQNQEIVFKTEYGEKKVNFSNRKIGNFVFALEDNPLTELSIMLSYPRLSMVNVYEANMRSDIIRIDSQAKYINFVNAITVEQGNSDLEFEYISEFNYIAVNLGSGSSSNNFYLTKVIFTEEDSYQIKIENKFDKNKTANDDKVAMTAYIRVPKDININNVTFDVVW